MNKCLKCGAQYDGEFCPQCGAKYDIGKICPNCNSVVSSQAKFCNRCG